MNDNQYDGVQDRPNPPATETIGSQTFALIPELSWPGGNGDGMTGVKSAILSIESSLTLLIHTSLQGDAKISGVAVVK